MTSTARFGLTNATLFGPTAVIHLRGSICLRRVSISPVRLRFMKSTAGMYATCPSIFQLSTKRTSSPICRLMKRLGILACGCALRPSEKRYFRSLRFFKVRAIFAQLDLTKYTAYPRAALPLIQPNHAVRNFQTLLRSGWSGRAPTLISHVSTRCSIARVVQALTRSILPINRSQKCGLEPLFLRAKISRTSVLRRSRRCFNSIKPTVMYSLIFGPQFTIPTGF